MICQVRRRLHHAPRVARGADTAAIAGIGHKIVVPTVVTPRPGKAMREDAAFEVFAKCLADISPWRVMVTLTVELTVELACAGEIEPGLEMLGNGLVQQRALGVAWVVEFG